MTAIKNLIIWVILLAIGVSGVINITKQFLILQEARANNRSLEEKISKLEEMNIKFKKRIEYATSSAFLEKAARDNFGLGTKNDFWIIMTPEDKNLNLYPNQEQDEKKPIYQQWINLFTL